MNIIDLKLNEMSSLTDPCVMAIGFFDGLHLGHQALIDEVLRIAKKKDLIPSVMLFDKHPLTVLKGEKTRQLTSFADRVALLEKAGIKIVFRIIFTKDVAALTPEAFIKQFLGRINARHVVVGYDFRFGAQNSGSADNLRNQDFGLSVVPGIMYDKTRKVSTSLIKQLLEEGDIIQANQLLTRPFTINGKVIHGKARGRTMGFPTANVDYDHYYIPRRGVYGVNVKVNHQTYQGMANIGKNPTFDDINHDSLEINIFDFDEDIYDQFMSVQLIVFERPEQKFSGVNELMDTLHKDAFKVREMLKRREVVK